MGKFNLDHILSLLLERDPIEKVCANLLRRELPIFSHEYIDGALCDDVKAASSLSLTDNNLRPLVLFCLYAVTLSASSSPAASACFKEALANIWSHDGPLVRRDISASLLAEMFRLGGVRPDWQAPVTVYRGGQGSLDYLRRGWSWTTQKGIAAWFASRRLGAGEPLVIEAMVKPSRILHVCNERDEHEVVIPYGVRRAVISGTPGEWITEAAAWRTSMGLPS